MTRIRRLRLMLPARFAGIAPQAAREIAERMVDAAYDDGAWPSRPLQLNDSGQSPAQFGLAVGQAARRGPRLPGDST